MGPGDPSKAINKVPIIGRLKEFVHAGLGTTFYNYYIEFINDSEPFQFGGHRVTRFNPSELSIIYY